MPRYLYHESTVEIDREVLQANARFLHHNLAPGTQSMAVIKADAYGHGAVAVARELTAWYDAFAVANVTEAEMLREAGIDHPLLVFGVPLSHTADAYKTYDLTAVISAREHFDILEPGTRYHVEIDSGMGRLGFLPEELEQLLRLMDSHSQLQCEGVMTHFASADEPGSLQMAKQKKLLGQIRELFGSAFPVHAANSAASLDHPDTHADMVRHGIALYGYDPTPDPSPELRPVMRWKSSIVQCKPVRKGEPLSYGAIWKAPEDGWYAVIPAGYADGYRRNLSGMMPLFIEGRWYPQVGRVTMDYIMAWLGADRCPTGTEVLLMGGERNHAGIWADALGTIPYEICCGIHPKIPRVMV